MKFEEYSKTFLHFHTEEIPSLVSKYLSKGMSVADLGAGDGALLVALANADLIDANSLMVAVDLSEQRCQRLMEHTDFKVICSDVTAIPELKSKTIDFIICTQVIEHVDEGALLAEAHRLLKPDGVLYIASVIKKKYGWWYYRTRTGEWGLDPTHLREYKSREHFESVINGNGFNIVESSETSLNLSVAEFIVRRLIAPYTNKDVNHIFLRFKFLNWVRNKVNIHPPGYFIVETIAHVK